MEQKQTVTVISVGERHYPTDEYVKEPLKEIFIPKENIKHFITNEKTN